MPTGAVNYDIMTCEEVGVARSSIEHGAVEEALERAVWRFSDCKPDAIAERDAKGAIQPM